MQWPNRLLVEFTAVAAIKPYPSAMLNPIAILLTTEPSPISGHSPASSIWAKASST
jgi:hypothetical protein